MANPEALATFTPHAVGEGPAATAQPVVLKTNLAGDPIRFTLNESIDNIVPSASLTLLNAAIDELGTTIIGVMTPPEALEDDTDWETEVPNASAEPNQLCYVVEILGDYIETPDENGVFTYTAAGNGQVCTTHWRIVSISMTTNEANVPVCDITLEGISKKAQEAKIDAPVMAISYSAEHYATPLTSFTENSIVVIEQNYLDAIYFYGEKYKADDNYSEVVSLDEFIYQLQNGKWETTTAPSTTAPGTPYPNPVSLRYPPPSGYGSYMGDGDIVPNSNPRKYIDGVHEIQVKVGVSHDGVYGPVTAAAVKTFQKSAAAWPNTSSKWTGVTDAETWAKMFPGATIPGATTTVWVPPSILLIVVEDYDTYCDFLFDRIRELDYDYTFNHNGIEYSDFNTMSDAYTWMRLNYVPLYTIYETGQSVWEAINNVFAFNGLNIRFRRDNSILVWPTAVKYIIDPSYDYIDVGNYGTGLTFTYTKEGVINKAIVKGWLGQREGETVQLVDYVPSLTNLTPYPNMNPPTPIVYPAPSGYGTYMNDGDVIPGTSTRITGIHAAQVKLISKGFSCGHTGHDGIFGVDTKAAVKRFQASVGLVQNGTLGTSTWDKLFGASLASVMTRAQITTELDNLTFTDGAATPTVYRDPLIVNETYRNDTATATWEWFIATYPELCGVDNTFVVISPLTSSITWGEFAKVINKFIDSITTETYTNYWVPDARKPTTVNAYSSVADSILNISGHDYEGKAVAQEFEVSADYLLSSEIQLMNWGEREIYKTVLMAKSGSYSSGGLPLRTEVGMTLVGVSNITGTTWILITNLSRTTDVQQQTIITNISGPITQSFMERDITSPTYTIELDGEIFATEVYISLDGNIYEPSKTVSLDGIVYATEKYVTLDGRIFDAGQETPDYFIDPVNGDDTNHDGKSANTAWKSLAKLNSYASSPGFPAGTFVGLKRGSVFQNERILLGTDVSNGDTDHPLTIGAYGVGAKPILTCSYNKSSTGDWTETSTGSHVWWTTVGTNDIGIVVFNSTTTPVCGWKHFHSSYVMTGGGEVNIAKIPLTTQGAFYWNPSGLTYTLGSYSSTAQRLYVYSTSNPATYYPHGIECCQDQHNDIHNNNCVTVQDLDFRYGSDMGAMLIVGGMYHGQIVERCDFYFCGGSPGTTPGYTNRDGYGIEVFSTGFDIHIRDCTFREIYDRAISIQSTDPEGSSGGLRFQNIYVYRNFFLTGAAAIEYSLQFPMTGNTANHIYFVNNTVYETGSGAINVEKHRGNSWSEHSDHLFYKHGGETGYSNCVCKNNIFYSTHGNPKAFQKLQTNPDNRTWNLSGWDIDHNCYSMDGLFVDNGTYVTLSEWRNRGCVIPAPDLHSNIANPMFADIANGDFTPTAAACVGTGEYVSGINTVSNPNIGAVETGSAVVYYVSASGDDNHPGTEAEPWKTLGKINGIQFSAGTTIKFKRGDTFRGILYPAPNSTGVTFDAYGNGDKPIISGAVDLSSSSLWTSQGGNIWRATGLSIEIAQLFFNNDTSFGMYHYPTDVGGGRPYLPLTAQGDFYYDTAGDYLDLYSTSNPGSYYSKIEASQGRTQQSSFTSRVNNSTYMTFRNLNFKYMGGNGFELLGTSSHLLFEYCDFYGCGGGKSANEQRRDGNGIQTWGNISYTTVRYCTFDYIFEVACDVQLGSGQTASHMYYYGNTIKNSSIAFEAWTGSDYTGVNFNNIYFINNTVYNLCNVYYPSYLSAPTGTRVATNNATVSNCFIENNIFHTAGTESGDNNRPFQHFRSTSLLSKWVVDYNCYYPTHTNMFNIQPTYYDTLSAWQTASLKDAHSFVDNPDFVSDGTDFNLQVGSPCIGAGVVIPNFTSNNPNMGAY